MKQNRMKRNSKQGEVSGEKDFGSAVRKGYLSESVVLLFEQRLDPGKEPIQGDAWAEHSGQRHRMYKGMRVDQILLVLLAL